MYSRFSAIATLALLGGILVVTLALGINARFSSESTFKPTPTPSHEAVPEYPINAFLPPPPRAASEPTGASATNAAVPSEHATQIESPPRSTPVQAPIVVPLPPPASTEYLTLPSIPREELTINAHGAYSIEEYLVAMGTQANAVSFSGAKFENVLKDPQGVPLFPVPLIQNALQENNALKILPSLAVLREFITAKISFMKSIAVTEGAVPISRVMVGLDMLTLELIDKTTAFAGGTVSHDALAAWLKKYTNTALFYNGVLRDGLGGQARGGIRNIIGGALKSLGLATPARGIAELPFGGPITVELPCPCSGVGGGGIMIIVGPPLGGSFFIPYTTLASPAIFPFHAVHPGAQILGNYTPAVAPLCLLFSPSGCSPIGFSIGTLLFAGTSI